MECVDTGLWICNKQSKMLVLEGVPGQHGTVFHVLYHVLVACCAGMPNPKTSSPTCYSRFD